MFSFSLQSVHLTPGSCTIKHCDDRQSWDSTVGDGKSDTTVLLHHTSELADKDDGPCTFRYTCPMELKKNN